MRKRHAARPTLESVEDRVVLSASGALDATTHAREALARLAAQHAHALTTHADHHATAHDTKAETGTAHQHTTATSDSAHSKSSSSKSQSTLTSFFKSVFPGL